jgi:mRNA deadenylase 3'-5' endonuclease subunit Ccr4
MGAVLSSLGLSKKNKSYLFGKKGFLTAVSEGEEVVWTNFDTPTFHEKSFRYDVPINPPSSGSSSEARRGSLGSSRRGSQTEPKERKKSVISVISEVSVPSTSTTTMQKSTGDSEKKTNERRNSDKAKSSNKKASEAKDESELLVDVVLTPTNVIPVPVPIGKKEPPVPTAVTGEGESRRLSNTLSTGPIILSEETVLVPEDDQDISILSLNMLADFNLMNSVQNPEDGRYKHAVDVSNWQSRLPKLKEFFQKHSHTDVFALQEVDFSKYREDLQPMMDSLGYSGCHQWDEDFAKKGQPNHPFGLAVFYKKNKWRESFKESRSRSMILGISHLHRPLVPHDDQQKKKKGASDWYIVNVHLEADPSKSRKRMAQLSSALFHLSTHAKVNPLTARVVVLGDFNSLREEAPFQWLITNKAPTENEPIVTENENNSKNINSNEIVNENNDDKLSAHAFRFEDAYEKASSQTRDASTYADPFSEGRVDHLLVTADTCQVLSVLRVPALTERTKKVGVFDGDYPSDHYPVGCILKPIIVQAPAQTADDEEVDPNVCPLTEGQMRVLEFLENGAPKRSGKGKPTPAELAAIRQHTERVNAFCSHLTKQQKAWVNKWRKKFKPSGAATAEKENHNRITRSRSLVGNFEIGGISELFEGKSSSTIKPEKHLDKGVSLSPLLVSGGETKTLAVGESPTPTADVTSATKQPSLTKRRQTVHGRKTTFLDF